MSLKALHIVFITCSTLLAFSFGVWELNAYFTNDSVTDLAAGTLSLVGGVGLIWYGKYFLKKLKNISYL